MDDSNDLNKNVLGFCSSDLRVFDLLIIVYLLFAYYNVHVFFSICYWYFLVSRSESLGLLLKEVWVLCKGLCEQCGSMALGLCGSIFMV